MLTKLNNQLKREKDERERERSKEYVVLEFIFIKKTKSSLHSLCGRIKYKHILKFEFIYFYEFYFIL